MERVCLLPKATLNNLVKYELWLLKSPHDSVRYHGMMFFSITFQFRAILEEFDEEDGLENLRRFILSPRNFNEAMVAHVCVAYKRYFETHLNIKVESRMEEDLQQTDFMIPPQRNDKAYKPSPEEIQDQIESLIHSRDYPVPWHHFEQFELSEEITWLLKVIAISGTRTETVRNALDVLAIACVNSNVASVLYKEEVVRMNIIFQVADGKCVADHDVQKAALRVIVNCVCVPIERVPLSQNEFSENLLQKIWKSVQVNNGSMVLLQLLNEQSPDCIRVLACKALAGLARSERVRDLIFKFKGDELIQTLITSRENRYEHIDFQNYALELLVPHKCPEPLKLQSNFAACSARNQMGYESYALNRKFIHSRFCPIQTFTIRSNWENYTCVRFLPGNQYFLAGLSTGEIRIVKIGKTNQQLSFITHDHSNLRDIQPNRDGTLFLTSAIKRGEGSFSAMWSLNGFTMKLALYSEQYAQFSKTMQDRIIGTRERLATIFDVNTGTPITRLLSNVSGMSLFHNKATFSPHDNLVLSNGDLFDVATGQQIRKLDKLNPPENGVFHPNGLEIVSDNHIWDIRTFRLLKIVPCLHEYVPLFSPYNGVIYASNYLGTNFKTVDSLNYAIIKEMDFIGEIHYLDVNESDTRLAVLESEEDKLITRVRLYDIGKTVDTEVRQRNQEEENNY